MDEARKPLTRGVWIDTGQGVRYLAVGYVPSDDEHALIGTDHVYDPVEDETAVPTPPAAVPELDEDGPAAPPAPGPTPPPVARPSSAPTEGQVNGWLASRDLSGLKKAELVVVAKRLGVSTAGDKEQVLATVTAALSSTD